MDLGLGLFYYTLIVLLAVILTAATCLASYLVTRNKTYRYAFAMKPTCGLMPRCT